MIRMQRLCVGILLWVSLIGSLLAETPTSFEVRGTLRLPTGNGVVTTISLDGLLQSDLYQELLKELLENQHWYVDYVDEAHGCVISPEPQIKRGIYDIDASTATAIIDLTVAQTTHAGPVISVAMHPSGNFVLIGGTTAATGNHQSRIYALSSTGSALTAMSGCNQIYGGNVNGVAWHPSGNSYALVGTITAAQSRYNSLPIGGFGGSVVGVNPYVTEARIYGFDSERVTSTILPYAYIDHGATLTAVDWHPTGSYLAVSGPGGTGGYHIRVYSFNGAQLTQLPNCNMSHDLSSTVIVGALSWHPSGEYLAIGGAPGTGSLDIRVYHFVNETLLEMLGARFDTGSTTSELAWSPDGTMLAAVTTGGTLQLFTFDDKLRLTSRSTAAHGAGLNSVSWSPDGGYIAVGGVIGTGTFTSRVYQVQENTLTVIAACNKNHGATVWSTDWSPDGSFITVGGYSSGGFTLETYQFTEDIAFIVKKNKGMLYEIDSLVRDAYDAVVEAEETVYTTSDAMSTANRWYLKPNVSGSNISQGSWPWSIEGFSGYAEWQDFDAHPNGRVLAAISNLSASLGDGFLHIFDFDPESSYVNSPLIPRIVLAYPQSYDAVTIRTPEYIRWSPTGEYIIVGHGARGPGSADFTNAYITRIFNYDGTSLTAASTANFYSISDALASPNGSFILATSQTVPVRVFTYDGQYTQSFASVPFSNAGYTSNLQYVAWAPDGKSFAISVYNSSGGVLLTEQISFNSATGTLTELLSTQLSSFNGPIAFRPQVDPTDSRQYLATNQGIYLFNGIDANVPSYTFLPGTALSSPVILGWSRDGRYLATTGGIYEFVDNVSLLRKTAGVGGTSGPLPHASWLYDNKYILATPNVLYQLSQYSHQELLVDTSNAAAGLLVATSYAVVAAGGGSSALSISTSNAIVTYNRLAIETSNAVVTYNPLIIQTSNAVNAILRGTSNAMAQLERSTSNAIVTLAAQTINPTTSNAIVTLFPTLIGTSNAMNNYQPVIVGTSNAVNGLLVDTSNSMAGLLVATSRAAAGLLVATSNAASGLLVKDNVVAVSLAPYIAQLDTVDCGPIIHFNSATITLTYDLFISADHQLLIHTSGVVNGNGHAINFPRGVGTAMTLDPSVTITFQNTVLRNYVDARVSLGANAAVIFGQDCTVELGDAQDLSRTWSFAGVSRIKGFNTRLGVGTGQNYIEVQPQSTLKLEDLFVTTVRNNNIRCLNNNSSIQLQNAELLLDSDFSWTVGSLRFSSDVTMRGTSVFNYTTRMGSTIDTGSRLTIDQGMSFNYAPSSNFRNLLVMTDSTSLLQMTNATLISTATGVQLTKGTLCVDGVMSIQSAAVSSAEAVIFGDGAPANDLLVQLLPGANIQVTAGFLNYQNAN